MFVSRKNRLYILADSETISNIYYVENDNVKKQPFPAFDNTANSPFLPQNPASWKDEEIDLVTGDDYMLNLSFNLALEFIGDAAKIIRSRQYFGNGYEEVMYLVVLKWNREDDTYYQEYKGKLDLSSTEDTTTGSVKVNSVDGGVLFYLTANKSTVYEIACDETNVAIKIVLLDGMNLSETLDYSFIDADLDGGHYIVPVVFITNEGDHENVLYGSPIYEAIPNNGYYAGSENYIIKNIGPNPITYTIAGTLLLKGIDSGVLTGNYRLRYAIANSTTLLTDNAFITIPFPSNAIAAPFSITITLNQNDKLFLHHLDTFDAPDTVGGTIKYAESPFKISFISRKEQTSAFCLTLYDYYKQLVSALTQGKYTGESNYLKSRIDLTCTCGDALRNTDKTIVPKYVIASSFDDFFQSVPGDKNVGSSVGLQVRGNVLYLELLSDLYNESAQIYDLGEVSGLKFKPAQKEICNLIQNGYPDQTYDTNGGKYEVNSEQEWQLPVLSNVQTFDIRSKWRADPRGIEQIRSKYTHLDTTDNTGDKQPFLIQVNNQPLVQSYTAGRVNSKDYTGTNWIDYDFESNSYGATIGLDANNYIVRFTGTYNSANITFYITINNGGHTVQVLLFKNGQSIATTITNNTDGTAPISFQVNNVSMALNDNFEVRVIPFDAGFDTYTVIGATLYFEFLITPYTLLRLPYDSITGVLDNTLYNVELRPLNQILWHGNELKAKLYQLQSQSITLNTAAKNTSLSTTINGVTETENAPIIVASLPGTPLHINYDAFFTTQVPYTFTDLLAMSTAGYFSWTEEGIRFYGLPWGSLKYKPATNEAQQWQLRLSPKNLFTDMFGVSYNQVINLSLNNNNMIALNTYTPLHWIKYNFTPQSKYHHIDMHEDWSFLRFQNWVSVPFYAQKWQLTDIIKTPVLTTNLAALTMFVYDQKGNLYTTQNFAVISTPYVKIPYVLQECDISLGAFDEGFYLFVIKANDVAVWISEWCDIKINHPYTFLVKYSHSNNEKNIPWKGYNGFMELRVEAEFGQWEPDSEAVDYEDDTADFSILSGTPLQKRALLIGHIRKVPEWMGLKMNSILLKNMVYIDGDTSDETKHYTKKASTQAQLVRYQGMPFLSYSIDVIPATNPIILLTENIPVDEQNGWHATIDAQVFGDDPGTTDITILNQ